MRITLLANASLAVEYNGQLLLIDLPEDRIEPFATLRAGEWERILDRQPPYDRVCGLYFTHTHYDHCDLQKADAYKRRWGDIPVFIPDGHPGQGTIVMGPFVISFERIPHAPMEPPPPPHVVTWIRAGEKSVYLAADAKLDAEAHRKFLKGRMADMGFWNAMYLSRPETRLLMKDAAAYNYIYHMPAQEPDSYGIWKKCRSNLKRHGTELSGVRILEQYPTVIE